MSKINWQAKYEHEFVNNYKLLQQAFDKNNVHKHIEVEKLIKAKYQDNLEFFQWFKRFFDLNCGSAGSGYQAVDRRKGVKTLWDQLDNKQARGNFRSAERQTERNKPVVAKHLSPKLAPSNPSHKNILENQPKGGKNYEKELAELKSKNEALEKEKEYFFDKLRLIELFCEQHEEKKDNFLMDIEKILFATDNEKVSLKEDGTVSVEEE